MTDREKRAPGAKSSGHAENLLDAFGANTKKASTSSKTDEVLIKNANAAPVGDHQTPPRKSADQRAEGKDNTEKNSKNAKDASAKDTASAKQSSEKESVKKTSERAKSVQSRDQDSTVTVSTAKKQANKKATKDADQPAKKEDEKPRSSKVAHRVIPYVLLVLAVFVGVSLLLNLICNTGNQLESNPSAHWMGLVGYYICYWLFGVFGPAVFVLPLLILNLAFYWKQYVDRRIVIPKIIASFCFVLILGAVIHVFCMFSEERIRYNMTVAELMGYGAQMTGGGVLGGKLAFLSYTYFSFVGSFILGFLLLALSLFYFLGMTPQNLWDSLRSRRAERAERSMSVSEEDAENAHNKAQIEEKIRKVTSRQQTAELSKTNDLSDGAVELVEEKKSPEDKLAPMPMPRIDPNDGSRPFVPRDVGKKLNEANAATASKESSVSQVPASQKQASNISADAKGQSTPVAHEQKVTNPAPSAAKNQDVAIDPIFPKTNDAKQLRKIPKEDRNFDLKNVFVNLDEKEETHQRKHAPVPPEVPLGTRKVAIQKPAQNTVPASKEPLESRPAVRGGAPSISSVKPSASASKTVEKGPKPVFRQADHSAKKEYGLSNEEFEQLEAQRNPTKTSGAPAKKTPIKQPEKTNAPKTEAPKKYVFPPVSYLHPGEPMTAENRAEIQESMRQLAETLASFHVRVQEINYSCGPTVTRYEVILAAGVRVRTITGLSDDIALALRSSGGVRIEAPIPGTNAVGIEVPNKTRSIIYLRDLIESKAFADSKSKLTACLGADIAGLPLIFDIAKMPHLLIAGTTGSGKSVCINCIIMSLLYKVRPDEVKLILIDPKKVEFSIYKNIPHLMAPVVTQPKDAAGALQAAVEEMERRFEVFESVGVRDLKGYNEITANDPDMPFIPQIVIIIDELADLMMTAKNEVETAICRIAQKARAAGMHLIIGTQRPSADVVTGLIKANVPSSIAFAVKSQVDSRVILDHGGAEALTGRGDMLFVPIGSMRDTRVQGAFVDDKEVEKICEFIRATNGTAQYDERFISKLKELAAQCGNKGRGSDDVVPAGTDGEKGDDPKYADAVRVALEENRISTSLLQRKLEVGYSRAAKLIDRMQSEGIVSAPDGSKPRSILISKEEYLQRFFDNAEDGE